VATSWDSQAAAVACASSSAWPPPLTARETLVRRTRLDRIGNVCWAMAFFALLAAVVGAHRR
jgi:hypothetical protein